MDAVVLLLDMLFRSPPVLAYFPNFFFDLVASFPSFWVEPALALLLPIPDQQNLEGGLFPLSSIEQRGKMKVRCRIIYLPFAFIFYSNDGSIHLPFDPLPSSLPCPHPCPMFVWLFKGLLIIIGVSINLLMPLIFGVTRECLILCLSKGSSSKIGVHAR